ncbi:CP family cyanate transporter-like MFS transporter [Spinactinospora alkalitolerans]|uniref:CP family cyanate transporter-like MFS transporter n=1 Tax=Spinactinospora alkalitolerans TaxID=687207 RepID=A0A852TX89_9ACTN|nr:MFS transporter [Spinactinospora alkalitolerans]NYE48351.1 CP family cyanate transporter-like MFS transporter [Spinactinospora alkalitolerans]
MRGPSRGGRPRRVTWLLVAGVGLAAVNLRTAITSVGPVLDEITGDLGMSGAMAGLLTTLPVLCFAAFGALTPALIRRFGEHHVLLAALLALTAGLGSRVLVQDQWLFLALSALALSGGAMGNVLLPTLVKQHFPHRVGAMTTLYTTGLALGTTMAAAGTVPITQATGGNWHVALGCYAVFGLIAAVPWIAVLRHEPPRAAAGQSLGIGRVLRTAMGWQSVVFFGTQSTIAYIMFGWFAQLLRDSGMDATTAGVALSYLTALSIPTSLVLPGLMARVRDHRGFIVFFFVCYVAGFGGLWVAPLQGVWLWATLIGIGMGTFPLALTFFAVRTRTASATAAMSAVSQSLGYLMAGTGPFLFGLLHELTGDWRAPLAMLLATALLNLGVGMLLGRPRHLEDAPAMREAAPAAGSTGAG